MNKTGTDVLFLKQS